MLAASLAIIKENAGQKDVLQLLTVRVPFLLVCQLHLLNRLRGGFQT